MRRAFFVFLLIGACLAVYAVWVEPRQLRIRSVDIGSGSESIRLVVASDWHIGGFHTSPERIEAVVRTINDQRVDLILMPGDFITGSTPRLQIEPGQLRKIDHGLAKLGALNGTRFATIGNHDAWHTSRAVDAALSKMGITVLDNESEILGNICIVGLADSDTSTPSASAFDGCETAEGLIALMHSPDARSLLPSDVDLAVAGHTHGGQVNLPILGRAVTATRCGKACAYGLIQMHPPLFVTSGIGTSILPVRFRSPPEIVVVTLR